MSIRRVQIETPGDSEEEELKKKKGGVSSLNLNLKEDQEPFMGMKVRRIASLHRDYRGDYLDITSQSSLIKILDKQGDRKVLFADKVLKFTGSGKMKRRVLLITDFAIYIVDPETGALKRRIALAAVEKICLSELNDNFFAIVIPTEYDCLMASTRKSEIVTVLVEATKNAADDELEVDFSNRFQYHAAAEVVKEVQFEEVEDHVTMSLYSEMEASLSVDCRRRQNKDSKEVKRQTSFLLKQWIASFDIFAVDHD
ncbi:hypothetical protein IFM89_019688 [Coptis chinensis]|uniref:TH1 domain-containing protein n=1 Tax=Coptis chinensis TaxID=261450 RepID=A0A835HIM7_9MAGN|nr:hypothetical protein IFM89_019688 [Coptis chinensis]